MSLRGKFILLKSEKFTISGGKLFDSQSSAKEKKKKPSIKK
jgi:hypothetical protein